jgi:hypothetical protein
LLWSYLVAAGITLKEGECYSYKQPPVLGGDYTLENTCVLPITEHFGAYGSIHNQIKDLPGGSQVVIEVVKKEQGKRQAARSKSSKRPRRRPRAGGRD